MALSRYVLQRHQLFARTHALHLRHSPATPNAIGGTTKVEAGRARRGSRFQDELLVLTNVVAPEGFRTQGFAQEASSPGLWG